MQNRKTPFIATLPLLAFSAGAAFAQASTQLDYKNFHEVEVRDGLNASILPGKEYAVSIITEDKSLIDKLAIEQRGEKLIVKRKPAWGLIDLFDFGSNWHQKVTIEITTPKLTELEATSGADVRLQHFETSSLHVSATSGAEIIIDDIIAQGLNIEATSGATMSISGTCDGVIAEATSGADIWAEKLKCASGKIEVTSGADIDIGISERVEAEANSGGSANIFGSPEPIKIEQAFGGDITFRN